MNGTLFHNIRRSFVMAMCLLLFAAGRAQAAFSVKRPGGNTTVLSPDNSSETGKVHTIKALRKSFSTKIMRVLPNRENAPGGKKETDDRYMLAWLSIGFAIMGYLSLFAAIAIGISAYVWPLGAVPVILTVTSIICALTAVITGATARKRTDPKRVRRPALAGLITGLVLLGILSFIGLIVLVAST